jgi:hypothetical protein
MMFGNHIDLKIFSRSQSSSSNSYLEGKRLLGRPPENIDKDDSRSLDMRR